MTAPAAPATALTLRTDDGLRLSALLDRPREGAPPFPTVVLVHGLIALKEHLAHVAEAFCAAGLACVRYDHRTTGRSEGEPRHDIDPWAQVRDLRALLTQVRGLPEVDADRLGLWGTSLGGAHVLQVAAGDPGVRCVVSQVPLLNPRRAFAASLSADAFDALLADLEAERRARLVDGAPPRVLTVTEFFEDPRTRYYLVEHESARRTTAWLDELTLRSLGSLLDYDVTGRLPEIGPTPLLMVVPTFDRSTPAADQLEAFAAAREPKRLVIVDGDHYSPHFPGENFEPAAAAACEWFTAHLGSR